MRTLLAHWPRIALKQAVIVALLASASVVQAGDSADAALVSLAKVDIFAFGGVGYAGVISQGEKDYRVIMSRPSALADFEKLLAVANAQGRLYALVGIRILNKDRFKQLFQSLNSATDEVTTEKGCIVDRQPFGIVLKQIDHDEYAKYTRH
jgi:hypothetical protein